MDDTQKNNKPINEPEVQTPVVDSTLVSALSSGGSKTFREGGAKKDSGSGEMRRGRKGPRREERAKEFDQKTLSIRRVARVAAGGRRFSFSVALVAGNRKGRVGVGTGKGADTALAIDKAFRNAKKNMITITRTSSGAIPHRSLAKYSSARVILMPAPGRGLIAGSATRDVLELGGVQNVNAKIVSGSKNPLNIARATIQALLGFRKITNKQETNTKQESKAN